MAKISLDDLKNDYSILWEDLSPTLKNLFAAVEEIDEVSDENVFDFDSKNFLVELEKLTKEDIQFLENRYKKKYDKKFLENSYFRYEKEKAGKEKRGQRNKRSSRKRSRPKAGNRRIDFDDLDDFKLSSSNDHKHSDFVDVIEEKELPFNSSFSETISLRDLRDDLFLNGTNLSSNLKNFFLAVEQMDKVNDENAFDFDSKDFLVELEKLTREDIEFLENRYKKRYDKKSLKSEYLQYINGKKKKERKENRKNSGGLFGFLKRNKSKTTDLGNPFDDLDLLDTPSNLSKNEKNDPKSLDISVSKGESLDYGDSFGVLSSKEESPIFEQTYSDVASFSKGEEVPKYEKGLTSDSYLSILGIIEITCGQNIIEQFQKAVFEMKFNSNLSLEQYISKSNFLIDEVLSSLSFDEDKVLKMIQECFCLNFSPSKTTSEIIRELVGDELRYYQQDNLPKNHNISNNLGTARLIRKNTKPLEDGKLSILFNTKCENQESSYKFNLGLFEQNNFSIISSNDMYLSSDYIRYTLMKKLFDADEFDLDVIPSYNGEFHIALNDWYVNKTK